MSEQSGTEEMVVLGTADGAWYVLPSADVERARIKDATRLDELKGHMVSGGDEPPDTLLSAEMLKPFRLDDKRAAELEAAAITQDTAGFTEPQRRTIGWFFEHQTAYGVAVTTDSGGTVTGTTIYRVPLDLVAQRAVITRLPGYGR